jgi:hypothetical protein
MHIPGWGKTLVIMSHPGYLDHKRPFLNKDPLYGKKYERDSKHQQGRERKLGYETHTTFKG